jgi:C4-dicarboxylate-specific signal transduction histidine kinase
VQVLIRRGDFTFEASLESADGVTARKLRGLPIGSRLAVTGVYEVQDDEYGRPGALVLLLRSGDDVRILDQPSWWTLPRLLAVLVVVVVVFVISLIWGFLISRKNLLLRQAQAELQTANSRLEARVRERTQELEEQVEAKERARAELAQAQQTLVRASRRAGMAEVATGVLHNVGNVLNSVNVSASCLRDQARHLPVEYVSQTASLLHQPREELARFLCEDPKGRTVPEFLAKLGETLARKKQALAAEIESLTKNVEHINAIVSMQQDHARVGGVLEELQIKDVVEDAIRINAAAFDRHGIELVRHYQPVNGALLDRHKLMQILVNLLQNAKHAVEERASGRQIVVSLSTPAANRARVTVADNGVGIASENLNRIFSQGFTTRKEGHGFGLHNGALVARELGGSLSVHSDGLGQGADFTLEFLCRPNNGAE